MISAIVLAKNEEKNIGECLQSLSWCDEVIVIDDNSKDQTAHIARKYNARVINNELEDFAMQRNFALQHAKHEWVLFVDADERVSESLQKEIIDVIENDGLNGYYLKRTDVLFGRVLRFGEAGNIRLLRLGKKSKGKWVGKVHEVWKIDEPTSGLKSELLHFPHQTVVEFLDEINRYSEIRANELKEQRTQASFFSIIFYPKAKFFVNYIFKLGFLDGIPGLISAIMMSFHSFLVRGKLWLLWHKKSAS